MSARRRIAAALTLALIGPPVTGPLVMGPATAGPAEPPPEGFAADRYTDSRGCVFQRAEVGGQPVWAAVLDAERRQVCGTGDGATPAAAAADGADAPLPSADAAAPPEPSEAAPSAAAGAVAPPSPPGSPPATAAGTAASPAGPTRAASTGAFVQIGAYGSRARAQAVAELAREAGFPAAAQGGRGGLHLVRLGPFRDAGQLRYALAWARAAGFADAFRVP